MKSLEFKDFFSKCIVGNTMFFGFFWAEPFCTLGCSGLSIRMSHPLHGRGCHTDGHAQVLPKHTDRQIHGRYISQYPWDEIPPMQTNICKHICPLENFSFLQIILYTSKYLLYYYHSSSQLIHCKIQAWTSKIFSKQWRNSIICVLLSALRII